MEETAIKTTTVKGGGGLSCKLMAKQERYLSIITQKKMLSAYDGKY